eukprot:7457123-Alexandrium_andersonii.AAC.1
MVVQTRSAVKSRPEEKSPLTEPRSPRTLRGRELCTRSSGGTKSEPGRCPGAWQHRCDGLAR